MRGKHGMAVEYLANPGITPAYAGKTRAPRTRADVPEDHPRVCGENSRQQLLASTAMGSPPRMRGKRFTQNWDALRNRITPAYAGKTSATTQLPRIYRDHPRVCGENFVATLLLSEDGGSPPRMRGKLAAQIFIARLGRITPAYAGKTFRHNRCNDTKKDHPRVCGENNGKNRFFGGR